MAKSPCVLIVDDSIDVLQTLGDILGVAGYTVRTAPSAERALQILENVEIDLVITDLRMGGMGGMSLIRRLRESWPGIPVVALSGFADAATVAQAFREGAVDFLIKPFTAGEVLEAVSRALAPRAATGVQTAGGISTPDLPSTLTPIQRAQAEEILRGLHGRLGAELVVLVGTRGELLATQGLLSDSAARAVAQGIAQIGALQEPLAAALGEPAFATQTWEGEGRVLYVVRLEDGGFLAALVPRAIKPGMAWLELREARTRLQALRGEPSETSAVASEPSTLESVPEIFSQEWEIGPVSSPEGELLSYEEARSRGLIPDLGEELESEG
ncbi:response regulator [Thermoflexus sp.]|uniref:response regulator n=1 Tax=Thermoflexus sp. TaxID=1969742 RepID=UPI0025E350F3|nr:response regulator [Thermoflexus sp.]MCS6965004.1 response regulator [Thermoflexus sp.]MCX7691478.1 response regulator [Thermoflexus sp.]MDW8184553.1 response regulator [Anaerolineae bacterium]